MAAYIHVCDDEIHITRALSMKLTKAGYEVECTQDGLQAWESIQRRVPDMLITDFQMPRMDGTELCRAVREWSMSAEMPILMLTAKGYELDTSQMADELKLAAVMTKPFSLREILGLAKRNLDCAAAGIETESNS